MALADGFKDGSALFRYVPFSLFLFPYHHSDSPPLALRSCGIPRTGAQQVWCLPVTELDLPIKDHSQLGTYRELHPPSSPPRHLSVFPPFPLLPATYQQPASTCYLRQLCSSPPLQLVTSLTCLLATQIKSANDQSRSSIYLRTTLFPPLSPFSPTRPKRPEGRRYGKARSCRSSRWDRI